MKCPVCESDKSRVTDSRNRGYTYRRRLCKECGERYSTYEISVEYLLDVLEERGLSSRSVDKVSNILEEVFVTDIKRPKTLKVTKWTDEEIDTLKMNYPSKGSKGCAELLPGRSQLAIWKKANQLGVHSENSLSEVAKKRWIEKPHHFKRRTS